MSKLFSFLLSAVILCGVFGLEWKKAKIDGIAYAVYSQSDSLRKNFEEIVLCAEDIRSGKTDCQKSFQQIFAGRDAAIRDSWPGTFDILETSPHWAWVRRGDYDRFNAAIAAYGRDRLRNKCIPIITYMYTEGRTTFNFDHRYRCNDDPPRPPSGGLSFILTTTSCAPAWTRTKDPKGISFVL